MNNVLIVNWKGKELSLEDIGQEVPKLRDKLKEAFPSYFASLRRVSEIPVEFERRCRSSWIEALLEKTRQRYQDVLARYTMIGLVGGMLTSAVAMVTRQPVMPQEKPSASSLVSITIWPSGDIKPILTADPPRGGRVVVVTFEAFEHTVLRLKDEVLKGKLLPEEEDEIPRLMYYNLAKAKP